MILFIQDASYSTFFDCPTLLKDFFAEIESKLIAFYSQKSAELRRSAVEHSDFAFLLVQQLLEHFVPVRSARVCPGLQPRDQISFFLYMTNGRIKRDLRVPCPRTRKPIGKSKEFVFFQTSIISFRLWFYFISIFHFTNGDERPLVVLRETYRVRAAHSYLFS